MEIDDTSGQQIASFAFIFDVSDDFSISNFSLGDAATEWTLNASGVATLGDGSMVLKIDAYDEASLWGDPIKHYLTNGTLFSFDYVGTLYVDPIEFAELTYDDGLFGYNLLGTGEYNLVLSDTKGVIQRAGMQTVPSPSTILLVFTGFCFITGLTRRQKLAIA